MQKYSPSRLSCLVLLLLLPLAACATLPTAPAEQPLAYLVADGGEDSLLTRHAPVFIVEEPQSAHNRIGTPTARLDEDGEVEVLVDPDRPAIYAMRHAFSTDRGSYTNLIYRIHFREVPFSLVPFHLTAGRNVGLLVIITLDQHERPVLVITDHTCGCYLSFTATQHTPPESVPEDFCPDQPQPNYGEELPGRVTYTPGNRLVVRLRPETHRVRDLAAIDFASDGHGYQPTPTPLLPLQALEKLPLGEDSISFFENDGGRQGYVRQSHKPWERLLMSWWAFDWRVGEDKKFMPPNQCGTVFYTSLKPWAREESDLCNFKNFLIYWGWRF